MSLRKAFSNGFTVAALAAVLVLAIGLSLTSYCYFAYEANGVYSPTDALCVLMPFLGASLMCAILAVAIRKAKSLGYSRSLVAYAIAALAFVLISVGLSIMTRCHMAYAASGIYDVHESLVPFMPFLCGAVACLVTISCMQPLKSRCVRVK